MKKIIAIVATLAFAPMLVACGSSNADAEAPRVNHAQASNPMAESLITVMNNMTQEVKAAPKSAIIADCEDTAMRIEAEREMNKMKFQQMREIVRTGVLPVEYQTRGLTMEFVVEVLAYEDLMRTSGCPLY